ncbi:MAG: hypothetical protein EP349_01675 [Alphaproteobacteria bacterium]|nr:MAG: hypothetical protein EP349_01675 [Alphaproteobacteria bacterium]
MAKLWQRQYNPDTRQSDLSEISLDNLRITAPTVVFFSGCTTINRNKRHIAGAIKRIEEMLGMEGRTEKPVNILSWSYKGLKDMFNVIAYHIRPQSFASKGARKAAAHILMPLLGADVSCDKKFRITGGTPLPAAQVKANLKNLTLFGYSSGSAFVQEVYNATLQGMTAIGYDEKTAKELLHDIVLISAGSISQPKKETDRFTTLYLAADNDHIIRGKDCLTFTKPLTKIFNFHAKKLKVKPLSETSLHVSAPVPADMHEWKREKSGNWVQEKIKTFYPRWMLLRSHHELPHYVTYEDKQNEFSKMAIYALTNALKRTGRPEQVIDLIKPVDPFPGASYPPNFQENRDNYVTRVAAAMHP